MGLDASLRSKTKQISFQVEEESDDIQESKDNQFHRSPTYCRTTWSSNVVLFPFLACHWSCAH